MSVSSSKGATMASSTSRKNAQPANRTSTKSVSTVSSATEIDDCFSQRIYQGDQRPRDCGSEDQNADRYQGCAEEE